MKLQTYLSPSGFHVLSDEEDAHTHIQHTLSMSLQHKHTHPHIIYALFFYYIVCIYRQLHHLDPKLSNDTA